MSEQVEEDTGENAGLGWQAITLITLAACFVVLLIGLSLYFTIKYVRINEYSMYTVLFRFLCCRFKSNHEYTMLYDKNSMIKKKKKGEYVVMLNASKVSVDTEDLTEDSDVGRRADENINMSALALNKTMDSTIDGDDVNNNNNVTKNIVVDVHGAALGNENIHFDIVSDFDAELVDEVWRPLNTAR